MANKRRRTAAASGQEGDTEMNGGATGGSHSSGEGNGSSAYQYVEAHAPSNSVPAVLASDQVEELKSQRKRRQEQERSKEEADRQRRNEYFEQEHDQFEAAESLESRGGGRAAAAAAAAATATRNQSKVHEKTVVQQKEIDEPSDDEVDEDGADISDLPKERKENEETMKVAEEMYDSEEEEEKQKKKRKVNVMEHVKGERDDQEYRVEDGTVFEPFNLKEERKAGYFDESGNYIRYNENDKTNEDPWLQEIDEAEKKGDIKLPPVDLSKYQQQEEEEEAAAPDFITLLSTCVSIIQPGETVSQGMRRLRKESTSKGSSFDKLVEAADELVGMGHMEVYNYSQEYLQQQLDNARASAGMAPEASSSSESAAQGTSNMRISAEHDEDAILWEYKWGKDSDQVFGPFPSQQMHDWSKQGMFNFSVDTHGFEVWIRRVPNPKSKQTNSDQRPSKESLLSDLEDANDRQPSSEDRPKPSFDQPNTITSSWVRAADVDFRRYAAME